MTTPTVPRQQPRGRFTDDAVTLYRAARILEHRTGITSAVRHLREQAGIIRKLAEAGGEST